MATATSMPHQLAPPRGSKSRKSTSSSRTKRRLLSLSKDVEIGNALLPRQLVDQLPLFNIEKDGDPRISWFMYYDFMVTKSEAYYQLQPGYLPTEKYPPRVPSGTTKTKSGQKRHPCRIPDCKARPFTRHCYLERHFRTCHVRDSGYFANALDDIRNVFSEDCSLRREDTPELSSSSESEPSTSSAFSCRSSCTFNDLELFPKYTIEDDTLPPSEFEFSSLTPLIFDLESIPIDDAQWLDTTHVKIPEKPTFATKAARCNKKVFETVYNLNEHLSDDFRRAERSLSMTEQSKYNLTTSDEDPAAETTNSQNNSNTPIQLEDDELGSIVSSHCPDGHVDLIQQKTPEASISSCVSQASNKDSPMSCCLSLTPVSSVSPTNDDIDSILSDEETEFDDTESNSALYSDIYGMVRGHSIEDSTNHQGLIRPILSPMKQALVDRVMEEFEVIFSQAWTADMKQCAGMSGASPGGQEKVVAPPAIRSSPSKSQKRQNDDENNQPPDEDDGRPPKRHKSHQTSPKERENIQKLACPYRKHSPNTYGIYNYRSCALSHWDTVARVKEHLYRRHRVPIQCKRCWLLFKTQDALDTHLTLLDICTLKPGRPAEGLTSDLEKRLRSRKKLTSDQTEEERWREIYRMLFPNEVVPLPYFEPVQDEAARSPDSRDLAIFEDYSRRELPRLVRHCLEEAVNEEAQPLEEHLKSQLVSIIRDCQERVFATYSLKLGSTASTPMPAPTPLCASASPKPSPAKQETVAEGLVASDADFSTGILASAFKPPLPRSTTDYLPDLQDIHRSSINKEWPKPDAFSDSGYDSGNPKCICSSPCSCPKTTTSFKGGHPPNTDMPITPFISQISNVGIALPHEFDPMQPQDSDDPNFDWSAYFDDVIPTDCRGEKGYCH